MTEKLEELVLLAWVGEDELGSGQIGIKAGMVPAGCIPLVAVEADKWKLLGVGPQLEQQARVYGKTLYLARFTFAGIVAVADGKDTPQ